MNSTLKALFDLHNRFICGGEKIEFDLGLNKAILELWDIFTE